MSKTLLAPVAIVIALALAACGGSAPADNSTAPATETPAAPADTMAPAEPAAPAVEPAPAAEPAAPAADPAAPATTTTPEPETPAPRRGHFTVIHGMIWCGREDSNFHILRYSDLNAARLPIPPRPHTW